MEILKTISDRDSKIGIYSQTIILFESFAFGLKCIGFESGFGFMKLF